MTACVCIRTGCCGSEDTVWPDRGTGTVHQRSQLHVFPQPQTHHTAVRDCLVSSTHAGMSYCITVHELVSVHAYSREGRYIVCAIPTVLCL